MSDEGEGDSVLLGREAAREFTRQVSAIMTAISRSMEQFAFEHDYVEGDLRSAVQDAYLDLQRINFRFKSTSGRLRTKQEFDEAVETAVTDLSSFLEDFQGSLFRELRVRVPNFRIRANVVFLHPDLHQSRSMFAEEILYLLQKSLVAAVEGVPYFKNQELLAVEDFRTIKRSIPSQKIAPAQFGVENGKLVIVDQNSSAKDGAEGAIASSLESLLSQSEDVIDDLRKGNCDRRIVDHFDQMKNTLKCGGNVVRLGLENITAKAMAVAFSNELADGLMAQINGLSAGIAMYVAQFEEWQVFVQNAAEAAIAEGSERTLTAFLGDLQREFEKHSAVVDPEVPATVKYFSELINDPSRASKRAIFAFMRTIENLISKSFEYVIEILSKTASKSSDKISDSASSAIVRGLAAIGIVSALGVMPIANDVAGMEWIKSTYQIFIEQIAPILGIF